MKVGVIGLGTMGGRMAEALLGAGHEVMVYDVSEDAVRRAAEAGAEPASSGLEVGAAVRVVLLSLPRPEDVEDAVAGEGGILSNPAEGLIVADTSTVDPSTTRRLAERADAARVGYLDSPILGPPDNCGKWTFPVGGDAGALEIAHPVLDVLGTATHVGESGAGHALKLLNNLMFGAINAITAEVFAAASLVGVSPHTFYETVADSGAATVSNLFRQLGPRMLERDFSPVFTVDLLSKDNRLAMDMIGDARASAIVGSAVTAVNSLALASGHGSEDTSATVKVYENLSSAGDKGERR